MIKAYCCSSVVGLALSCVYLFCILVLSEEIIGNIYLYFWDLNTRICWEKVYPILMALATVVVAMWNHHSSMIGWFPGDNVTKRPYDLLLARKWFWWWWHCNNTKYRRVFFTRSLPVYCNHKLTLNSLSLTIFCKV